MNNNSSYLNFTVFIITTILYFLIKPDPNIKTADGKDEEGSDSGSGYMMLGAYFLVVILSQFFANAYLITQSCGGSITANLAESAKYTILAWLLIFGVTIVTVVGIPDMKSAFSDVYGYYIVSGPAQTILTELLKDKINTSLPIKDIVLPSADAAAGSAANAATNNAISETVSNNQNNNIPFTSNAAQDVFGTKNNNEFNNNEPPRVDVLGGGGKNSMQKGGALTKDEVSDLVLKIYGNMSILINQLTPSNFNYYWENMLTPLFKDKYKPEQITELSKQELEKNKKELLTLVIKKDNVGEGMWYIYTGILICSLVQFKLSGVGCKSNQELLASNYKKLREDEKSAANAANAANAAAAANAANAK